MSLGQRSGPSQPSEQTKPFPPSWLFGKTETHLARSSPSSSFANTKEAGSWADVDSLIHASDEATSISFGATSDPSSARSSWWKQDSNEVEPWVRQTGAQRAIKQSTAKPYRFETSIRVKQPPDVSLQEHDSTEGAVTDEDRGVGTSKYKRPFRYSGGRLTSGSTGIKIMNTLQSQQQDGGSGQYPIPGAPSIPGGGDDNPIYRRPSSSDDTLALILPLLILLSTLLFLLLLFIILVIVVRRKAKIALQDADGPLDVGREEELDGLGGLDGVEQRWLETVDEPTRQGYARAKDWALSYPPGSQSTDITLSQFLTIQEKGVSAWSFDPDYESNPSVFVEARTEITFLADGEGMAPEEGGGCCVQSNLPLPKLNEVYYWEAKMFTKPETTNIALGLATKPYPNFRLPGWSKFSVGYFSADGFKSHNYPFSAQSYGPAYVQGDVIGVGYRPRTGTVFFTRNGKRLEDAFIGLHRHNLFPTVGADGAAEVHINLGQAGFVFIEANVKKWGLAPMVGTLAPPPAYGQERGSILIETGQGTSSGGAAVSGPDSGTTYLSPPAARDHRSRRRGATNLPVRSSPLREARGAEGDGRAGSSSDDPGSDISENSPPNPPTPHHLDISMHSLHLNEGNQSNRREVIASHHSPGAMEEVNARGADEASLNAPASSTSTNLPAGYFPPGARHQAESHSGRASSNTDRRSPSPPPYSPGGTTNRRSTANRNPEPQSLHPNTATPTYWESIDPSLGGTPATNHQARRGSGRTHSLANSVLGMLSDRGLLTPLSASTPSLGRDAEYERSTLLEGSSRIDQDGLTMSNTAANARGGGGGGFGRSAVEGVTSSVAGVANGFWSWFGGSGGSGASRPIS